MTSGRWGCVSGRGSGCEDRIPLWVVLPGNSQTTDGADSALVWRLTAYRWPTVTMPRSFQQ